MKLIIFIILSINILALDFRNNNWGDSVNDMLKIENLREINYKENFNTKTFNTHIKNFFYNYNIDEYSFPDSIGTLGTFKVTFSFLKNKLYKGTYTKEIKENDNTFEIIKQYLIWKYGENYKTYGIDDCFEWTTDNTKIVLNLFLGRNYTIEYYANSDEMKNFINSSENGKEFIKNQESDFREYNKIKEKI